MKNHILVSAFLVMGFATGIFAQPGNLDPAFGNGGLVKTTISTALGTTQSTINAVAIQPNEKIVAVGSAFGDSSTSNVWLVVRYNADGTLDNQFGTNGVCTALFDVAVGTAWSVALQADGKIVVAGQAKTPGGISSQFTVVRLNVDGTLDNGFGTGGKAYTYIGIFSGSVAYSVAIQPNKKIILAGSIDGAPLGYYPAIARFNPDGSLDYYFGNFGTNYTNLPATTGGAYAAAIQSDGKIVLAGQKQHQNPSDGTSDVLLIRYNYNGIIDSSFGLYGMVTSGFGSSSSARSVCIQPNQKILIAGKSSSNNAGSFLTARFNADGSPDPALNGTGMVITNIGSAGSSAATAVTLQSDGKILVAGQTFNGIDWDFALVRYNKIGASKDATFGVNGVVVADLEGIDNRAKAIAFHNGKIVVAGQSTNGTDYSGMLARYLTELNVGVLDLTASNPELFIYPNPIMSGATLSYALDAPEFVSINLFDLNGRLVNTCLNRDYQEAGKHQETLRFPDEMPGGVYNLVLTTPDGRATIKVVK